MAKPILVELDGKMVSRKEYCECMGYKYSTIISLRDRFKLSWEEAVERYLYNRNNPKKVCKDRRLYNIWKNMLDRCYNPKNHMYYRYGGRGIIVQESWHDYFNFEDDMYESYKIHCEDFGETDTTIEREDYDGNYCIENCTWETRENQANNKSNNVYITDNLTIAQVAKKYNLKYGTVRYRLLHGWTLDDIIKEVEVNTEQIILSTGETLTELSERTGISKNTLYDRYRKGYSVEEMINPPNNYAKIHAPTGETLKELAERLNVPRTLIENRYFRGWTWDEIINTPNAKDNIIKAPTGETLTELSKRLGVKRKTLEFRYRSGWTWDEIMHTNLHTKRESKFMLPCHISLSSHCKQNSYNYDTIKYHIERYNLEPHEALAKYLKKRQNNN